MSGPARAFRLHGFAHLVRAAAIGAVLAAAADLARADDNSENAAPSARGERERPDERGKPGAKEGAPAPDSEHEFVDPEPEGCPFNDQRLELIVRGGRGSETAHG